MRTCRARSLAPDDHLSSSNVRPSTFPPSPIDTSSQPWRSPPLQCDIANPALLGPNLLLDTPPAADLRAKSTPPFDQYRQVHPVYPSPPLTDAALASTVPLPDIAGELPFLQDCPSDREGIVNENMSHDGARHVAPLSPPPTVLIRTTDLPDGEQFPDGRHQVESWRYGGDLRDGEAVAPPFLPVRDDSGFEEFGQPSACEGNRRSEGSQGGTALIEPTSVWSLESPLCMDEDLPLPDLPPLHGMLAGLDGGDRSSGNADILVSPIGLDDGESSADSWISPPSMDWAYSPSSTFADDYSAPSSPKPSGFSLDLPSFDTSLGFPDVVQPFGHPAPLSPAEISCGWQPPPHWLRGDAFTRHDDHQHSTLQPTLSDDYVPFFHRFHKSPVHSLADVDSDYSDTIMPPEEMYDDDDDSTTLPPSSPRPRSGTLNDLHDSTPPHQEACLTPAPRSPHSSPLHISDIDMEDPEPPDSPHSPHHSLPQLEDEDEGLPSYPSPSIETISPSLLCGAPDPQAGLGLTLQPLSDLPLARSPSPDEDDLGFLDIQLDPESTNLEIDEFLQLRALRKNALALERAARMTESELSERINAASSALLPPSHARGSPSPDAMQTETEAAPAPPALALDPVEKRVRKRELQAMMDMRADARRTRKLEKQRSKEIGALLDFKMHPSMSPMEGLPPLAGGVGKGWTRSIAHLVAHMVMRRRERAHPLEYKPPRLSTMQHSPLFRSVSAAAAGGSEEDGGGDDDDDMEM